MRGDRRRRTGGEEQMGLMLLILAGAAVAVLAVRTAARQEGFLQAAVNALFGLAALLAVNLSSRYTGVSLGFNVFNGLVAGILGAPGVVLLLLAQWVLM